LVGRPNVGKSTLFTSIGWGTFSIVNNTPGTTRDRLFGEGDWNGITFDVVDTGGIDPSTGGKTPLSIDSADYISQIRSQAEIAIQEADAILFLTDAIAGVTPADQEVAQILRRNQREKDGKPYPPVLLVVIKLTPKNIASRPCSFTNWGWVNLMQFPPCMAPPTGDLLDALVAAFSQARRTA